MVDVRLNYKNKYKENLYCPVCGETGETTRELDSQQHLLLCAKLHEGISKKDGSIYSFIFSFNLEKMKEVAVLVEKAWLKRASIIS